MTFNWQQVGNPPAADEAEVTVIGPGFGECIIVHTGHGRWLIVDSCWDPELKKPVALLYLRSLGIDPARSVDWVVSTHWHADHVGGISEVVSACSRAQFFCATVLQQKQFLVYAAQSRSVTGADKGREFLDALQLLRNRGGQVQWTQGGGVLFATAAASGQPPFRIEALSPSAREYSLFLNRIVSQLAVKGQPHRAPIASDPNLAAIVLSLQWGSDAVLLGADLIADLDPYRGWLAAVNQAKTMATPQASLVKIPHHGSDGAHCPEMWSDLLSHGPLSVITPYCRGAKASRPPKPADLDRISRLSSRTVLTAPTKSGRARKQSSAVALGLSQYGIKMRTLSPKIGIARLRRYAVATWRIEVFGQAKKVK